MHAISGALRADSLWASRSSSACCADRRRALLDIHERISAVAGGAGTGAWLALALFLAASGVVFLSALRHVIDMAYGTPGVPERALPNGRLAVPIVAVAIALLVVLGLWMPLSLLDAIGSAAAVLAG